MFRDITGSFEERSYLGNRTGSLQANLPKSARLAWHGGDMAMLLREAWNVEEKTYTADTILGLRLQDVLGSVPRPTILRCGAVHAAFFVHGFLLSGLLDEVRPHFQLFRLDGLGGSFNIAHITLARIGECAAPSVLRKALSTFSTTGLIVTRHEAVAEDGERIPYFQTGPDGPPTGRALLHVTSYGGLRASMLPHYSTIQGKLGSTRVAPLCSPAFAAAASSARTGTRPDVAGSRPTCMLTSPRLPPIWSVTASHARFASLPRERLC
ncbi:hypothetical protein LTR09_012129 [Extremus antarcticus]|uniref:Uncharacterized protein n=1 Tax=Extremus antarcticus TaxID=702011 RepID=A0AAJ0D5H2_9PEZI|nr:hypothetical protein LTR09_012129 [Extremus antarcticus]